MNSDANASFLDANFKPDLPVGTILRLEGHDYEITGVVEKKEEDNDLYFWREYYLQSSFEGLRFLTEYDGHWTFVQEIEFVQKPRETEQDVFYKEKTYRLFNKYKSQIRRATGSFPIDLRRVKNQKVIEYIAPPQLLTVEYDGDGTDWFLGKYISPEEIKNATSTPVLMPYRSGFGAIQPNPVKFAFWEVMKFSILAAIAVAIVQFFVVMTAQKRVVLDETFSIQEKDSLALSQMGKTIITRSFELKNGQKNLDFELQAAVQNSWFEAEMTLINEKTGEERGFSVGVEYYEGVESGERWTEGENNSHYELEGVPAGKYHLEITPIRERIYNGITFATLADFKLRVKYDVPQYGSLLCMLLLLCVYPLVQYFREGYFETKRWENSDYSPYQSE
jgi:Domain of unknown function (DUF4178)